MSLVAGPTPAKYPDEDWRKASAVFLAPAPSALPAADFAPTSPASPKARDREPVPEPQPNTAASAAPSSFAIENDSSWLPPQYYANSTAVGWRSARKGECGESYAEISIPRKVAWETWLSSASRTALFSIVRWT